MRVNAKKSVFSPLVQTPKGQKDLPALKVRQSRNDPSMTQTQKIGHKQGHKSHQIDDMNVFLKTRTEEQDRRIK